MLDSLLYNLGFELVEVIQKCLYNVWIKDCPAAFNQHRHGFLAAHCLPIISILAYCVETIRKSQDSRSHRNLVAAQSVGITAAIPSLVMLSNHRDNGIRKADS